MAKRFTVDGVVFETKKALLDELRVVRDAYPVGVNVSEDDVRFLTALLEFHPQAATKIGVGIARMWVEPVPPWNTLGFMLERVDGTRDNWSYMECLSPSSTFSDFRAACRTAIQDQKLAFLDTVFTGTLPTCALSGVPLTRATVQVDHVAPFTLTALASRFLAAERLQPEQIALRGHGALEAELDIFDLPLRDRWKSYHLTHARLRALDAHVHRRLKRK